MGEGVEGDLGGGVLGLAERGAVVRALEHLSIEVHRRLEPRRVIRTLPYARVRREVEAASLCQLLKLVLVHSPSPSSSSRRKKKTKRFQVGGCVCV